jgi:hypothetical protein
MANEVDPALKKKIESQLVEGKLPCVAAFKIADEMKISRAQLGDAANKLGIKISACQLGCFP